MNKLKVITAPTTETVLRRRLRGRPPVSQTHAALIEKEYDPINFYEPHLFGPGSGECVEWVCPEGHKFSRSIATRTKAIDRDSKFRGCPICAGRMPLLEDSLAHKHPKMLPQWLELQNGCMARDVAADSDRLAYWQCVSKKKHVFRTRVSARTAAPNGQGCPSCYAGPRVDLNDFPQAAAQFDRTAKNFGFEYTRLPEAFKVFWQCREAKHCRYESFADLRQREWQCAQCIGEQNSRLSLNYPEMCAEILSSKNSLLLDVNEVRAGSHKIVTWQCPAGVDHIWEAPIYARTLHGKGCPFCANRRASITNNLKNYPDIAKELHPSKNGISADKLVATSTKNCWWLCSVCQHEWQRPIRERTQRASSCPKCKGGLARDVADVIAMRAEKEKQTSDELDANVCTSPCCDILEKPQRDALRLRPSGSRERVEADASSEKARDACKSRPSGSCEIIQAHEPERDARDLRPSVPSFSKESTENLAKETRRAESILRPRVPVISQCGSENSAKEIRSAEGKMRGSARRDCLMEWLRLRAASLVVAVLFVLALTSLYPQPSRAQAVTWTETDIGSPGATGSLTYVSGTPATFTIKGAGTGFGAPSNLALVTTPACGNFEIEARVYSQQNTGNGAVAGLCLTDSLQDYSQMDAIYVTPGDGLNYAWKSGHNGGFNTTNGPSMQTAPVYLRLTRTGTATGGYTDSSYYSSDGINWTQVDSHLENAPIPNFFYVGFVVSSSVSGTLSTAVFDHVSYITSVPQQASNLLLWLRSDVGVTYSGSAVSAWADQSGNSYNATQSSGTLQPTLSTGSVNSGVLPSIAFSGSQYLSLPSGFSDLSAGLSCFVVMNRATSSGTDVAFTCGNSSNSNAVLVETTGANAAMYCYNGATSSNVTTSSTPITSGSFQLLDAEYQPGSSAGTGTLYVNDTQEAQATNLVSTLNNTSRSSNYVGTDSSLSYPFDGSIAEILVFSGITPSQRALVMSYILSKYGIGTAPTLDAPTFSPSAGVFAPQQAVSVSQDQNATVYLTFDGSTPSTSSLWFYSNRSNFLNAYPSYYIHLPQTETIKAMAVAPFFNNSAVTSTTFQVDPMTSAIPRNGLVMWLRGDNSVTTSGSSVTSWGDVSGSGNDATNASNQPTLVAGAINSLPAVNFSSGSSQFLQVPAGMSNFTSGGSVFIVTNPASVTAGARFLDFGNGSASDNIYLDEPTSTGASLYTYNGSTGSSVTSSSAITLGQYQLLEAIYNGSNTGTVLTNAVQGAQSSSMSTLNNLLRSNNYIGQGSGGGNYFNGKIAEILVFNREVTASEQAAIEGYLFNKYQPTTSNTVAAPTISVAGGTLSAPTQVAIEATTGSTIYFTQDGSTPTTSSAIYTGPINIAYSQTLKAIAVLSGVESSVSSASYTLDSTEYPAPNAGDTTPLQMQLQLPAGAIPQDSNQH